MAPAHFFAKGGFAWEPSVDEEVSWELSITEDRLLEAQYTCLRKRFTSWNVYAPTPGGRSAEPVLSLKWDRPAGVLYVVRATERYCFEGYDASGPVIHDREQRRWVRELVGTVRLDRLADCDELQDELACLLLGALAGLGPEFMETVELAYPVFTYGQLAYCRQAGSHEGPRTHWRQLPGMIHAATAWQERARLLEFYLRAVPVPEMTEAATVWVEHWRRLGGNPASLEALLRAVFRCVSLSPWIDFPGRVLAFLRALQGQGYLAVVDVVDFLGWLLRLVCRHVTGFDLFKAHTCGAAYSDALLIDAVLGEYLRLAGQYPGLFTTEDSAGRLRRRAVRQAYLLRRGFEGHLVPDVPTFEAELDMVLPQPRVPRGHMLQPQLRTRRLYDGQPLDLGTQGEALLRASVADLAHPVEQRELGLALFVDRPLQAGRHPVALDLTVPLACLAYSRSIAGGRLRLLAQTLGSAAGLPQAPDVPGVPIQRLGGQEPSPRGTLYNAIHGATDYVFLQTVRGSVTRFLRHFDFSALARCHDLRWLLVDKKALIVRALEGPCVRIYDAAHWPRLDLEVPPAEGFVSRAGVEYPAKGLKVVRVWDAEGRRVIVRSGTTPATRRKVCPAGSASVPAGPVPLPAVASAAEHQVAADPTGPR